MIGENDAAVYTGKQVKDAADGDDYGEFTDTYNDAGALQQALIQSEGGFTYARMFNIEIDELNSIVNYGWLLSDSVMSRDENGDKVMEYTFWDGNEMRTDMQRTNRDLRELDAGTLITFSDDGEGYIKDVRAIDSGDGLTEAAITAADGNKIAIIRMEGVNTFEDVIEADSDTKVIYVDSNADSNEDKCVDEEGYGHYAGYDGTNRWINALYITGDDGKVDFILIDVDGHLKGYDSLANVNGLTAGGDVEFTYDQSKGQASVDQTLTASNINTKDAAQDITVETSDTRIRVRDASNDVIDNSTTKLTIAQGDSTVGYDIRIAPNTPAGDYYVTFTYGAAKATVKVTVNPAVIETYAGYNAVMTAAPAAGDRLIDLSATITATPGTEATTEFTAKTASGATITSENLKATDVVTLTVTLKADPNHVFDVDNVDLNRNDVSQLQNSTSQIAAVTNATTATITYTWTVSA